MKKPQTVRRLKKPAFAFAIVVAAWAVLETSVRITVDLPVETDFYSSIPRNEIAAFQQKFSVKACAGYDWIHLGWIAHPERQKYSVYRITGAASEHLFETAYGSCLIENLEPSTEYVFRVISNDGMFNHTVKTGTGLFTPGPASKPRLASPWRPVFRPSKHGSYINDHTVYRAADGWRITGITSFGRGDYSKELYFAQGSSRTFPPQAGTMMEERERVADFGRMAWAPHVILHDRYYMWYSPHRAYCATSRDGVSWVEEKELEFLPLHAQFRDPMVLKVAEDQWLMYATARVGYYSRVDLYQSFDMRHWQYIRPALKMAFGCERAGPMASTESPFVLSRDGRYYLSVTYNNDSFFWNAILLTMKIWPDRSSYNETLVFQNTNPYTFGTYRGRERPSSLVTVLEAHAPEYVAAGGRWYITTAGWPWAATLTKGEASVAVLAWDRVK